MLVGFSLFTGVAVLIGAVHRGLLEQWFWSAVCLGYALVALTTPLLLRRLGTISVPSAMLLAAGMVAIGLLALGDEGLTISQTWWSPFYAVLAIYLLGMRYGIWYVGAVFLIVTLDYLSMDGGWYLFGPIPLANDSLAVLLANCIALGLFGLIAYLHEVAQKRAMGELADALLETEKNERQLESVLESTTAAICSLDMDLELLAFNSSFAALIGGESPLAVGDRLSKFKADPRVARWLSEVDEVLSGGGSRRIEDDPEAAKGRRRETVIHPIVLDGGRIIGVTLFSEDIEDRKQAEEERRRLHQELVQVSREAGMASVASEVLHTVGNVLNSVGVSAAMMNTQVERLRSANLEQVVALLDEHIDDLESFLNEDPRGSRMLELLRALANHFVEQERQLNEEGAALKEGVDQLTKVLRAQQAFARQVGVIQTCTVEELIDMAMSLQSPSWAQRGIAIERDLKPVPQLRTDRHRVLEILLNLIGNARHALRDCDRPDKRLLLRAEPAGEERVRIVVEDNGVGVDPEVAPKLFQLGFTTKPEGNGLGLHAGANAARLLGGTLSFESDGVGKGARFTLELPVEAPKELLESVAEQ
ncbi:sensor histidine kinase [Haliangium sp.]|uniref:sensor histidine kinase n=1 Tax=Haliangium sp. TaxID=2663208 RepID=UPI003D126BFD